jgi:hypothetical protein
VWLLDVDGVVNVNSSPWGDKLRRGHARADNERYTMRWAPQVVDYIREVHEREVAEVRWCTTWCDWADQLERLWKLPRFERAFTGVENRRDLMRDAKRNAARDVLAAGRRLIWTDDIEVPHESDFLYLELFTQGPEALLIKPPGRTGLSPAHLALIDAFIEKRV